MDFWSQIQIVNLLLSIQIKQSAEYQRNKLSDIVSKLKIFWNWVKLIQNILLSPEPGTYGVETIRWWQKGNIPFWQEESLSRTVALSLWERDSFWFFFVFFTAISQAQQDRGNCCFLKHPCACGLQPLLSYLYNSMVVFTNTHAPPYNKGHHLSPLSRCYITNGDHVVVAYEQTAKCFCEFIH